jgi:hypothetical protein
MARRKMNITNEYDRQTGLFPFIFFIFLLSKLFKMHTRARFLADKRGYLIEGGKNGTTISSYLWIDGLVETHKNRRRSFDFH